MLRKKYAFSGHGRLQMSMICATKHLQKHQFFPLAPLELEKQLYTYFERWRDKKQAFASPCDWRNLKFGLFASVLIVFLHFCRLHCVFALHHFQETVRVKWAIFYEVLWRQSIFVNSKKHDFSENKAGHRAKWWKLTEDKVKAKRAACQRPY